MNVGSHVRIVHLVHGPGLRNRWGLIPRIRARTIFAREKWKKKEKSQESALSKLAASCSTSAGLPGQ